LGSLRQWIQRVIRHQIARFLVAGASLNLLDLLTFLLCRKVLGIDVPVAQFIARFVGATTGFGVHKLFTFSHSGDSALKTGQQGMAYAVVTLCNLLLSPFLVTWLVWMLDPYEIAGKLLGDVLLAVETFVIFRYLFRGSNRSVSPQKETTPLPGSPG